MNGAITKINGEGYFFDQYGCRQNGLVKVTVGDTVLTGYFGSRDSDGKMRISRIDGIADGSGEKHTFYFNASGSGKGPGLAGKRTGSFTITGFL